MSGTVEFTVVDSDMRRVVYIGQVICRGRSSVVVLLTEPFSLAGRIVEMRTEEIVQESILGGPKRSN